MTTYYLNGNPLVVGADISLNGFTYPYSWLEGTTASVRASFGIEKQGDQNFNTKYYWAKDNPKQLDDTAAVDMQGNPVMVKTIDPETQDMVDTDVQLINVGLKTTCTDEVKSLTNNLLKPTDYYIIRNHVEGLDIPSSIVNYRSAVIAEQDRITNAIMGVESVEDLIEIMTSFSFPKAE